MKTFESHGMKYEVQDWLNNKQATLFSQIQIETLKLIMKGGGIIRVEDIEKINVQQALTNMIIAGEDISHLTTLMNEIIVSMILKPKLKSVDELDIALTNAIKNYITDLASNKTKIEKQDQKKS